MKKLLLAIIGLFALSVQAQEAYIEQKWKEDVSNLQVGDTITLQLQWVDIIEDSLDPNPTLVQIDWNYNGKLIEFISNEYVSVDNPNASVSFNDWVGYTFVPKSGKAVDDLSGQRELGLEYSYIQNGDNKLNRLTIQDATEIIGSTGQDKILYEVKYKLLDIEGTEYTDYTDLTTLNWAVVRDNSTGVSYSTFATPHKLSLENVQPQIVPAGQVTFDANLKDVSKGADYDIVIERLDDYNSGEYLEQIIGTLDSSGKFTTTELGLDVPYIVNVFVRNEWDEETQTPTYPAWLDDVVTVSDVILAFQEAIGANVDGTGTTLDHPLQRSLANVDAKGPNDPVDFDDSYALLAHLAGILENAAGSNEPPVEGEETRFYPITSFNNGAMNWSAFLDKLGTQAESEEDWLAQRTFTLTSADPITFDLGHALMGDVDLSHSSTPSIQANVSAKGSRKFALRTIDTDIDVLSELKDGLVELSVDVTKNDLVGMQMNLSYDKSILSFKEVIFDTGNAMTNFAKPLDGKIIVGTIDPQIKEAMKSGRPFKVVFETKQTISNTAGLISFDVTDAVTKDGTKVNLNIR